MRTILFPLLSSILFPLRESIENSTAAAELRESDIANALSPDDAIDFSESADGWFKIAPYGTFRGKKPGRMQVITPESGRAMESEFNSVFGRLGRKFRGVPIYHGHPDVDPEMWPDDRRIGKVTKVEARADGVWGFAEWNSIGEENKREGWWIYPSPRWDAAATGKGGHFSPDRLISIGLTNVPRITESEPVFYNALDPGADPSATTETEPNTDTIMDPKIIRQKLNLPPEATDEEVMAKLESLTTAATEMDGVRSELETVKTEKTDIENSVTAKDAEITRLREDQTNSAIELALVQGRITAADRPAWQARLQGANRDEEFNSLRALKPVRKTGELDIGNRREERAKTDDVREEVHNSVAKLQKDEGLSWTAAWAKVKKDKQFEGYFNRTEG